MSFINSQTTTVIRAKLTDKGRKLLAQGQLTYNFWVFGDSEIDYNASAGTYNLSSNKILVPKDKNYNVKYPIPVSKGANIFNTLSNNLPTEGVITNVATTRGLFDGAGFDVNKFKATGEVGTIAIEGNDSLNVLITSGEVGVGDIMVIGVKNSTQVGNATNNVDLGIPYLTYKVQAVNGSTGTVNITVDRLLPNIGAGTAVCRVYFIKGGDSINSWYGSGSTTSYWNNNTLSFENNCNCIPDDVTVWNLNIVYTENLAGINAANYKGIDTYESKIYTGFKEYLNYTSSNKEKKAIGIIHYTNNTNTNYYGENLKTNTFRLALPTILWHNQNIVSGTGEYSGLYLSGVTTTQSVTTNTNTFGTSSIPFSAPYDNLVDGYGLVVGKVFTSLKIAVIENEELLAAMSYKSNRNWTLPTLNGSFVAAATENLGLIGSNEEVYVSYLLENDNPNGYGTGLHCQNYKKINRGGQGQNNIKVNFPPNQLPYLKKTLNNKGGFTANKLHILVQKVTIGERPVSGNWRKIDVTSQISGSGNINPVSLEAATFTIDLATYNGAPIFNLHDHINIPTTAENEILNFGEEYVLMGKVDTHITATTYKSLFIFPALSNQFRTSVNPTFSPTNNDAVYITEIGIYNNLKELVAVGKLSEPIKKLPNSNILLQLEIDF